MLSRKEGQRVRVGPNVWVTLIDVDRGKVRLGFDAPPGVRIAREELLPLNEQYQGRGGNGEEGNQETRPAGGPPEGADGRTEGDGAGLGRAGG